MSDLSREQVEQLSAEKSGLLRDLTAALKNVNDQNASLRARLEASERERDELQRANNPYCLICGKTEPCMTEADLKPSDPGVPCTFDYTPRQMLDIAKQYKTQLATAQARVREVEERLAIMTDAACQFEQQAIENEPKGDCEETTERNPQSWAAWKRKADTLTARCTRLSEALTELDRASRSLLCTAPYHFEGNDVMLAEALDVSQQALAPTTPSGVGSNFTL